jgi:hypothetical protein
MDLQTLFNIIFGAFSTLAGWTLNNLYQAMKELNHADQVLATKVQAIEVLVAGTYVKRDEFEAKMEHIYNKLDKIDSKISNVLTNQK